MLFIKISDPVDDFFSVNGSSRAGGKNLLLFIVMVNILIFPSGKRPSQCTVIISRIVHLVMVMKLDHFCLAGKSFFMSSEGRYHLFQKIRFCFRVIIQKQYIRRACRMNSLIHSPAESIVFRKLDHVDPRIFRRNKSTAAVCGPIVHQYNLKIADGLSLKT